MCTDRGQTCKQNCTRDKLILSTNKEVHVFVWQMKYKLMPKEV
jgi:hypothetical protein